MYCSADSHFFSEHTYLSTWINKFLVPSVKQGFDLLHNFDSLSTSFVVRFMFTSLHALNATLTLRTKSSFAGQTAKRSQVST